jgi:ABC-type branched-subunit amino acid transport system ATPase component
VILELGRKTAEGPSAELMRDPKVQSAYLGI